MGNVPSFDSSKFRLGSLCNRKHEWGSTGQSLRFVQRRDCVECYRLTDRSRIRSRQKWSRASKSRDLVRRFGITLDEYDAQLEKQNGVCAICGSHPTTMRLAVDHCHKTGDVRGLLCGNCNRGIGYLKDDINILEAAIAYLRSRL